ncbi:hypothetical protein OTU49_000591 [Cherax quadricarinatus]|uniref:Uncharacterized protein n=1 Tax=Cherax quadricarinatus TaxID=27406 RepID=A0AAW0XJK6_CHEQU
MTGAASRALPRLLSLFRDSDALRPSPTPRTITSFQGLQGLALQPRKKPSWESQMTEAKNMHLEAVSYWHDLAEDLRQARVLPPEADDTNMGRLVLEQVVGMLDLLKNDLTV